MLLITENTKSNLKNVERKVYELRMENKRFSRVLQIKHEKCIHIKMTNVIETSIVFAFPVYYSRISMVGFVLELCSALEVESVGYKLSPRRKELLHICIGNILRKRENANNFSLCRVRSGKNCFLFGETVFYSLSYFSRICDVFSGQ